MCLVTRKQITLHLTPLTSHAAGELLQDPVRDGIRRAVLLRRRFPAAAHIRPHQSKSSLLLQQYNVRGGCAFPCRTGVLTMMCRYIQRFRRPQALTGEFSYFFTTVLSLNQKGNKQSRDTSHARCHTSHTQKTCVTISTSTSSAGAERHDVCAKLPVRPAESRRIHMGEPCAVLPPARATAQ